MTSSVVFDIAFVAVATLWVPVTGLIWLGKRRENARTEALLREATGRAQLHHISRGRAK